MSNMSLPLAQRKVAIVFALCQFANLALHAAEPVKVFILAGQSNMEGKAQVKLMDYQATQPDTQALLAPYRDGSDWQVRDDVWIKFLDRKGKLTVGFGSPDRCGPELGFGRIVGDHFEEPVVLIKTAWGGKSLYRDFRPPSSGLPADEVLAEMLAKSQKRKPETNLEDIKNSFGHFYREMHKDVQHTLANLGEHFPDYDGQGYELAGFVWFQGWNDMVNPTAVDEYEQHMGNFIRDVRKELNSPQLPFIIGQLGVDGANPEKPSARKNAFKAAQIAPAELEEFQGNVGVVKTDIYWDATAAAVFKKGWKKNIEAWEKVGSDYPFHYLGSAKTYIGIGEGFGDAVLKLRDPEYTAQSQLPAAVNEKDAEDDAQGETNESETDESETNEAAAAKQTAKTFYDPVEENVEGWTIKVDPKLLKDENRELKADAFKALANHLQRITYIVPAERVEQLKKLPIWIDLEHELTNMQYHPGRGWLTANGHDPRLVNHVHIPRAKALLDRGQWAKHPYVVLHELAHSYHDQVLGFEHAEVKAAYDDAKEKGIYEKVLLYTGQTVRHYGLTNEKEYFAEATEAYFGVNDFYPFVRAELKEHDPKMYGVLQEIWGHVK